MKNRFIYPILLGVFTYSCASFKAEQQTNRLTFPELGSIVKTEGALWYGSSEQVGLPHWSAPIKVQLQQLPFNPSSYTKYANLMTNAGKINSITYVDSFSYKPKYIRIQLLDKISLTRELNNENNRDVLSYLENGSDYKLVTRMDFTVPETETPSFENVDNVILKQDIFNKVQLVLVNNGKEKVVDFSTIQVFDFEYSSFCWGEDRYHRKQIENIVPDGEKCPKGTYKKPNKVKVDKTYLKF